MKRSAALIGGRPGRPDIEGELEAGAARRRHYHYAWRIVLAMLAVCLCHTPDMVNAAPEEPQPIQMRPQRGYDDSGRRPPRPLPREAFESCIGKKEGDPCTVRTPQGLREGECLSGVQNIFACRPHRGGMQPEVKQAPVLPPTEAAQEPGGESRGVPVPEAAPAPKNNANFSRSPEPVPGPAPGTPVFEQNRDAPVGQNPAVPVLSTGVAPAPAVPDQGIRAVLGQHIGSPGSYLAVALAAAGLVWYLLYRSSTVPLRRLRLVTRQLAGGDLAARVGEGLVFRKSEVAELGRDVDRMAERIESLVGAHQRLIRDVSHELRSPLARLNVALELARQSAGAAHAAPFDRIERESDRLNELIGQLLMLTRLDNESGSIPRQELDLAALVAEIAQDVDFEARGAGRSVVVVSSESLHLNGNRELLRQAVENLVRNAVRYTADGTAVEISLRRKEAGGRAWAHVEVRDRGPGVPEAELYDIFRPFYRVNDARERKSGGTGVGLAISDRAVRLHGGSLRAFNAPGVGLIMEMELPLVTE